VKAKNLIVKKPINSENEGDYSDEDFPVKEKKGS
jgi:hypothetical protein